jgi:hypothetical protein
MVCKARLSGQDEDEAGREDAVERRVLEALEDKLGPPDRPGPDGQDGRRDDGGHGHEPADGLRGW